jgi:hypothetical protein
VGLRLEDFLALADLAAGLADGRQVDERAIVLNY